MTNLEIQAANAQINMRRDVSNILDNLKVNHPTKIDWEQRRYEIAKDVLASFLCEYRMLEFDKDGDTDPTVTLTAQQRFHFMLFANASVYAANTLIKELKKKKE